MSKHVIEVRIVASHWRLFVNGHGEERKRKVMAATKAKARKTGKKASDPVTQESGNVCSRCNGTRVDPEMKDCTCDCCGGSGEEYA